MKDAIDIAYDLVDDFQANYVRLNADQAIQLVTMIEKALRSVEAKE
jgi:hypothetical protein